MKQRRFSNERGEGIHLYPEDVAYGDKMEVDLYDKRNGALALYACWGYGEKPILLSQEEARQLAKELLYYADCGKLSIDKQELGWSGFILFLARDGSLLINTMQE